MSSRRPRLHEDLKSLLVEALNDQAAYCESFADTLSCAAALAQMRGRLFYADQLSLTALHRRVEAIKLRAFVHCAVAAATSSFGSAVTGTVVRNRPMLTATQGTQSCGRMIVAPLLPAPGRGEAPMTLAHARF